MPAGLQRAQHVARRVALRAVPQRLDEIAPARQALVLVGPGRGRLPLEEEPAPGMEKEPHAEGEAQPVRPVGGGDRLHRVEVGLEVEHVVPAHAGVRGVGKAG